MTNDDPKKVSLRRVFDEMKDMRKESKADHEAITVKLNTHSIQLACLEAKWGTFWKLVKWVVAPVMGIAIGAAAVANLLLRAST